MTTIALPVPTAARVREVDNRNAYISFGLAYVLGHRTTAISQSADPLVVLPGWLPSALLGAGLAAIADAPELQTYSGRPGRAWIATVVEHRRLTGIPNPR
jgi:hypothetical protein